MKKEDTTSITADNVVNSFIVYQLGTWSQELNADFTIKDCLFESVKIIKNVDTDKYSYSGYGIGFDSGSLFSVQNFDWGKNVVIFGVDMNELILVIKEKIS